VPRSRRERLEKTKLKTSDKRQMMEAEISATALPPCVVVCRKNSPQGHRIERMARSSAINPV
jgi:hypothetical protein